MKGEKSLPLILASTYIMFTMLISYFGPRKYYNYNFLPVLIYISAVISCLWLGYFLRKRVTIVIEHGSINTRKINVDRLIAVSINIAMFSIVLELICMITSLNMSLSLSDMGKNYIAIRKLLDEQGYNIGILFRFFTGIFRNIALILGFYSFFKLKMRYRVQLCVYVFLLILVNIVGYGTQKILGDILIFFLVAIFINMISWSPKKRIAVLTLSFFACCVVFFVFAIMQSQRYASIGVTAENFGSRSDGSSYYDLNNIVFKIFGPSLGFGISTVLSYLSMGYYGLSLSFKLPFEWTYGLGNSYVISAAVEKLFGVSIYTKTYLGRLEQFGRNGLVSWNTIIPWLTSDFTFLGVLFIFVVVGYFFTSVWFEVLRYKNPVAIVMFGTLCMGFAFFSANNQLFHGIDAFIATMLTFLWYILCHKKYNIMENYGK